VKKTFVITTVLIIGIISCTHKPFPVPAMTKGTTTTTTVTTTPADTTHDTLSYTPDTSVCFQRDVLPIFISSCAISGCHSAASRQDGYNLTYYNAIISKGLAKYNSSASKLYTECTNGKMPKSPIPRLDSTQLSFIRRWIDKGAPNDTNCAMECDTNSFTYSGAVAPILKNNCYSCHATSSAVASGGGNILDTYSGVLTMAQNGKLVGDLMHNSGFNAMPLGGNALPACQIIQIQKWIATGALNN